jgi:hypothetical protein
MSPAFTELKPLVFYFRNLAPQVYSIEREGREECAKDAERLAVAGHHQDSFCVGLIL